MTIKYLLINQRENYSVVKTAQKNLLQRISLNLLKLALFFIINISIIFYEEEKLKMKINLDFSALKKGFY